MPEYVFNPTVAGYAQSNSPSGADQNFATKRGLPGQGVGTGSSMYSIFNLSGFPNYWFWSRSILIFDTSSLPDDIVIESAVLRLFCEAKTHPTATNTSTKPSQVVVAATPTSDTGLVAGDYAISHYGSTRLTNDIGYDNVVLSAYNEFILNASGLANISKTGKTKFGLLLGHDLDNSDPGWSGGGSDGFGWTATPTGNTPQLVVRSPDNITQPIFFRGGVTLG